MSDSRVKEVKKQILIESELHAPFKSYCSSVEKKPVKAVISELIRTKLNDSGFKVLTKDQSCQSWGSSND